MNTSARVLAISALVCVGSCKVQKANGHDSQTVTIADLRVTNQISPWTESPTDTFTIYNTVDELGAGAIDGEAHWYKDQWGLDMGQSSRQKMVNGSLGMEVYCMDFLTPVAATSAYTNVVQYYAGKTITNLGAYPTTVAEMITISGFSYMTYAHFGRFLMRMTTSGTNDPAATKTTSETFVDFYNARISN